MQAGLVLVRSDNGDDGVWKEIRAEFRKDADRLFKMVGEAYTVLSDPDKVSNTLLHYRHFLVMHDFLFCNCLFMSY